MNQQRHSAPVSEVFSSIQGEGIYIGRRQIFVRLQNCNLACSYCDTPRSNGPCRFETVPGSGEFSNTPNPVSCRWLRDLVDSLITVVPHHSISITGGEPLLHAAFLKRWLPSLENDLPVHLETNGTLPDALADVIEFVDVIAMDVKLPSATGLAPRYDEHRRFLKAASAREAFVKVVFGDDTPDDELLLAAEIVQSVDACLPFVLQPVTGNGGNAPSRQRIISAAALVASVLPNVLVIPQAHKMMGCL